MEYFKNLHYKDKVHLSGNARTVYHRQWGTYLIECLPGLFQYLRSQVMEMWLKFYKCLVAICAPSKTINIRSAKALSGQV